MIMCMGSWSPPHSHVRSGMPPDHCALLVAQSTCPVIIFRTAFLCTLLLMQLSLTHPLYSLMPLDPLMGWAQVLNTPTEPLP